MRGAVGVRDALRPVWHCLRFAGLVFDTVHDKLHFTKGALELKLIG